jgi:plasmid stabilization system protein ParE
VRRGSYVLTVRAEADLREARSWSRARWGKDLTSRYFQDLHDGAQYIAEKHTSLRSRHELAGGTAVCLYPVREHYIVYEPLTEHLMAVVAVIRQRRDVPAILQKWAAPIRRELTEIRAKIDRHEIPLPQRTARKPRKSK